MSIFCQIDDKFVPLYRVMWIAAVPHFCGDEECQREGFYEIRLEQDESVWAKPEERDKMLLRKLTIKGGEIEVRNVTQNSEYDGLPLETEIDPPEELDVGLDGDRRAVS